MIHVGIGYDVHALVAGESVILGGVTIPHTKSLTGHSDADVLIHAVCDAIFGAIGESDIGQLFPNSDPRWQGEPSTSFLREAQRKTQLLNGTLVNVDATVIAERPIINPYVPEMKRILAEVLQIPSDRIGIKATTNERLGFLGREEGIAAMAVASVDLNR